MSEILRLDRVSRRFSGLQALREVTLGISKGEVLLTLEAMKMETTVRAERDGVIKEIAAKPGLQVDAKDLLIAFE